MLNGTQYTLKGQARKFLEHQKAFILNNIMRTREMLRLATPGYSKVFQNIPFLLQVNWPQTAGYVAGDIPGIGIYGFDRSGFARIFRQTYPDRDLREILVKRPWIQSLTLIGSPGSIGHTRLSDLDYWVCINPDTPPRIRAGIKEKLDLITAWARREQDVEVHFFLLDQEEIRSGRLGQMDVDSSGEVMPNLLKEEYYRTLLHVAGRMPLWWVIPAEASREEYEWAAANLDRFELTSFPAQDFIDLGFPLPPGPREYLGAAMWQAHKSQTDPFKAVLKMVLILEQVESRLTVPLLCDQIKAAVLSARPDDLPVDPYLLTIRRVLAFARDQLELVRLAAWFKLYAPLGQATAAVDDPKLERLNDLGREWGWSPERLRDLFHYPQWPLRRQLILGQEIKGLLLDLYSRIAARLRTDFPEEVLVQNDNLTLLGAQILARYSDHQAKVEELPSAFHRATIPRDLNLGFSEGRWRLYDTDRSTEWFYATPRAARVAAWLFNNRLWNDNLRLRLRPGSGPMKISAVLALLILLDDIFPPQSFEIGDDHDLLPRPVGRRVLVINMEEARSLDRVVTAEMIYRTSLGEICHEMLEWPDHNDPRERDAALNRMLATGEDPRFEAIAIFMPPGPGQDELAAEVRSILDLARPRQKMSDRFASRSKTRLDLD